MTELLLETIAEPVSKGEILWKGFDLRMINTENCSLSCKKEKCCKKYKKKGKNCKKCPRIGGCF